MNILEGLQAVPNVHPLFVHFPIALLMIGGVLFFACYFFDMREMLITAKWNLILGSLASVAAVITGLIAASTIPHNQEIHEAMTIHRNFMIVVALLSLSLGGYLYLKKEVFAMHKNLIFLGCLALMLGLLTVGADFGGKMVFKYGAGTELFKKVNQESEGGHDHEQGEEATSHESHGHDH